MYALQCFLKEYEKRSIECVLYSVLSSILVKSVV